MKSRTPGAPQGNALAEQEAQFRNWLLERLLRFSVAIGMAVLFFWIPAVISRGFYWQVPILLALFGVLAALAFIKSLPPLLRINVVLLVLLLIGVYILAQNGLVGAGRLWLVLVPLLATLLLGPQGLGLWGALAVGSYAVIAWNYSRGRLLPLQAQNPSDLGSWGMEFFVPFAVTLVLGLIINEYRKFLFRSMEELQRNADLARRLQLQAQEDAQRARREATRLDQVALLARTLGRIRNREELLQRLVQELVRTFELYQANCFLVDARGERLELVVAAGAQGQALVDAGWVLPISGDSLPGRAAQLGRAETAIPAGDERFPLRRAEAALPLLFGGELLGVLGLYGSGEPFSDEDVRLFRILADQVAATLNILRLLDETAGRARELRTLYAQVASTSWRSLLDAEGGAREIQVGAAPPANIQALAAEALAEGQPRVVELAEGEGGWVLIAPLIWRETTLGYVAFTRKAQGEKLALPWDADTLLLATTAVERLASAFDTVRLLRDSRRKALYQEQLTHVADLMWSSFDVETIMRHGVGELGAALDANEVLLTLAPSPPPASVLPGTGPLPPLAQGEEEA